MPLEVTDIRGPIPALDPATLADREAIEQLARLYAVGIDARNTEMVLSLFEPDAPIKGAMGAARAHDYLPKLCAGAASFKRTMHIITNQTVVVDGDRAKGRSYCRAFHIPHEPDRPHLIAAVIYHDEYRKTPEGWIITARTAEHQWREG